MGKRVDRESLTNWQVFHRLWGKAVGTKDYDKNQWIALEKCVLESPIRDEKAEYRYDGRST